VKAASGAGNARGAGARSSFGWQTSVGRIARLLHREVARPVGEPERALAGKKSVSPLTWSADGQKVKRCACIGSLTSLPVHGLRVSACRFSIRWKAFSGLCPPCFHRRGEAGSSDSQVHSASPSARSVMTDQHIGRTSDSDSGVPAGDDGNVRGRHESVKALQGPRRSTEGPHPRRSIRRRSQRCAAS
jgi:hypothetical protein